MVVGDYCDYLVCLIVTVSYQAAEGERGREER